MSQGRPTLATHRFCQAHQQTCFKVSLCAFEDKGKFAWVSDKAKLLKPAT